MAVVASAWNSTELRIKSGDVRISEYEKRPPLTNDDSSASMDSLSPFERFAHLMSELPNLGADEKNFREDVLHGLADMGFEEGHWD